MIIGPPPKFHEVRGILHEQSGSWKHTTAAYSAPNSSWGWLCGIPERHSALRSFPSWLRIEPRRHPDYFRVRGDLDIAVKPFLACVQRVVSKTPVGSASATPPAGSLTRLPSALLGWIPCSDRCRARLAGSSEARRVWGEGQASRHDRAHIDQDGMWGQCGQVNPFWIARAYIHLHD